MLGLVIPLIVLFIEAFEYARSLELAAVQYEPTAQRWTLYVYLFLFPLYFRWLYIFFNALNYWQRFKLGLLATFCACVWGTGLEYGLQMMINPALSFKIIGANPATPAASPGAEQLTTLDQLHGYALASMISYSGYGLMMTAAFAAKVVARQLIGPWRGRDPQ
jgi:hypothetical protein